MIRSTFKRPWLFAGGLALAAAGTVTAQNPVTDWNNIAITTALAASQATAPGSNSQVGSFVYMAYVHLAIYDAVNAIDHRFQSYGPDLPAPADASKDSATRAAMRRNSSLACSSVMPGFNRPITPRTALSHSKAWPGPETNILGVLSGYKNPTFQPSRSVSIRRWPRYGAIRGDL
jgi:hypothetical protein